MKINLFRDDTNGVFGAEYIVIENGKPHLETIFNDEPDEFKATQRACRFIESRGVKKGDEIWGVYGLYRVWTGKKWRVEHASGI